MHLPEHSHKFVLKTGQFWFGGCVHQMKRSTMIIHSVGWIIKCLCSQLLLKLKSGPRCCLGPVARPADLLCRRPDQACSDFVFCLPPARTEAPVRGHRESESRQYLLETGPGIFLTKIMLKCLSGAVRSKSLILPLLQAGDKSHVVGPLLLTTPPAPSSPVRLHPHY